MSGVFGYLGRATQQPVAQVIATMGARMRHVFTQQLEQRVISPKVAVGRRHLGLLNQQPQPVQSADGKVALCLAGEFYFQEARRHQLEREGLLDRQASAAEFALALFLRDGASGLTKLEGAFACSIWDGRTQTLWLINDRYGLYPHYYAHARGAFAFAPELKGVISAPEIPRRLNETALAEYLRFQQLLGNKTWFEDVQLLPPASLLRYDLEHNQLSLEQYWDWDQIGEITGLTFDEAVEEASRRFQRAIEAMTAPPLRPGIFLSGGLDGRIILAFADQPTPPVTFTFGAPGSRDVVYAARLARRAGAEHHWVPLEDGRWVLTYHDLHLALTEGMHSWMHAHGISMLATARQHMDVNLSGWDGGTTMGGFAVLEEHQADRYYRYPPDEMALHERMFRAFCQDVTWPGMSEGEAASLLSGAGRTHLRDRAFESLRQELVRTRHYRPAHRTDYFIIQNLIRRSLQNQIVTQRSMLEVRCPYFDYSFVDFMYCLPDTIRTRPEFRRAILTRRKPELALVPYEKDDRLPHSNQLFRNGDGFLRRGKAWLNRRVGGLFPQRPRLYADYEAYLRTDLRNWAESILFDQRTLERGLFDEATVRSLWQQHLAGDQLWTIGKIAPLLTLEMVMRRLFEDAAPDGRELIATKEEDYVT
ncbi:asparagine synthetase B [Candidatus Chloroploca sp. Khr17]|uniref:asparagine synthetase B family protein n=1 Tax=Candidatus Chloroploca sp. Khr17 TaxID=2496869 RepID=UPI00101E05DA|nr:asparagine synthase-related protein [Candidatus Chloroploca sp. Khr17]